MFLDYLKSSFRYMKKHVLQNIVGMTGLTVGFVVYAFSSLWTGYVDSYDSFHKDADRIYTFSIHEDGRTTVGFERARAEQGDVFYHVFRHYAQINALDSLGIESISYYDIENDSYYDFQTYTQTQAKHYCLCIDSSFVDFFNPELVAGDWSFLSDLGKIAISQSYVSKEFNGEYPIGKEIQFGRQGTYTVGAVFKDYEHSFIHEDMMKKWNGFSMYYYKWLFFKLKEGVTVQDMLKKCEPVIERQFGMSLEHAMLGKKIVPLREVYKAMEEADSKTFIKYDGLDILAKASLLILLCAIVNHFTFFMNLLRSRKRELSLRRVNGASVADIALQMVIESCLPVLLSMILGLAAVILLKEHFMRLADIGMTDGYYMKGSLLIITAVLVLSVIISLIEVFVMSRETINKGMRKTENTYFRKVSIAIQITSGMLLMFALLVMLRQFSFMRNYNWGTARKDMAVIILPQEYRYQPNGMLFWGDMYRAELEMKYGLNDKIAAIPCVTGVYEDFNDISETDYGEAAIVSSEKNPEAHYFPDVFDFIRPELMPRMGLTVLEGSIPEDGLKEDEVVITENLLKALGAETLQDLSDINIMLDDRDNDNYSWKSFKIAAVIKNIHIFNYDDIPPYVLMCGFRNKYLISEYSYGEERGSGTTAGEISVSLKPGSKEEFESCIKELMDGLGIEYEIKYPEDSFFNHLAKDRNMLRMLMILCLISVFIAMFGVFTQMLLTCQERRREIAIRKAHGAKVNDILSIFTKEYGVVFLVSSALAFSVGYIVMHRWIQQFYYQAVISWWIYLSVLIVTAAVVVLTVISRVLKAASENPAEVIKSE